VFRFPLEGGKEIKCNKAILEKKCPYFKAMFNFNSRNLESTTNTQEVEIHEQSSKVFQVIVEYLYTGKTEVNSDDIIEILEACREFFIQDLKLLLEKVLIYNIQIDNFQDSLDIAKAFECSQLREAVLDFGKKNYAELYRKGGLKGLTQKEFQRIKTS